MPPYQAIVPISLILCYWFVFSPLLIYYAVQFYKLRRSQVITKRYYKLTIYLIICSLVTICIFIPYDLLSLYLDSIGKTNQIIQYTNNCLWALFTFGTLYIVMLRYWLLWFQVHWTS